MQEKNIFFDLASARFGIPNTQCTQCVSEIISGKPTNAVDICSAVYNHGNEFVPGIKEEIWNRI